MKAWTTNNNQLCEVEILKEVMNPIHYFIVKDLEDGREFTAGECFVHIDPMDALHACDQNKDYWQEAMIRISKSSH